MTKPTENTDQKRTDTAQTPAEFAAALREESLAPKELEGPVEANPTPIVRIANAILVTAIEQNASDIQIQPGVDKVYIQIRVNGTWQELMRTLIYIQTTLLNRYKIMASIPYYKQGTQQGHIYFTHNGADYDLQVTCVPSPHGDVMSFSIT